MAWSDLQCVELFHLHLLRLLATGREKSHLAVKGGCNLRFFFGSIRYSADLDLDVSRDLEPYLLRDKLDRLLGGPALGASLGSVGLKLGRVSAPKQTETTQRWKVELVVGERRSLHTKVEFSRRATRDTAVLEAVAADVLSGYQMLPLLVRHYPLEAALRQKARALVGRAAVQARDVFDLALLLTRAGGAPALGPEAAPAAERALQVTFEDFQSQVVAFLDPRQAGMYASRAAWNALQTQVVEALLR